MSSTSSRRCAGRLRARRSVGNTGRGVKSEAIRRPPERQDAANGRRDERNAEELAKHARMKVRRAVAEVSGVRRVRGTVDALHAERHHRPVHVHRRQEQRDHERRQKPPRGQSSLFACLHLHGRRYGNLRRRPKELRFFSDSVFRGPHLSGEVESRELLLRQGVRRLHESRS